MWVGRVVGMIRVFRGWLAALGVGVVLAGLWGSVVAQAAVTHRFVGEVAASSYWPGLAVGPVGPEASVAEKGALFVAGDGVQRFTASGAALGFACKTVACEGYVEGNRIKGTPEGEFPGVVSVVVDDATGEIFVSAQAAVDVFSASGEYLSQIKEVPASSGAAVSGALSGPGGRSTAGLAFDQATGELYVADTGEPRPSEGDVVDVFKVGGAVGAAEFVSQLGDGVLAAEGALRQTVAVAEGGLGEPGLVYVTDTKSDVVDVFGSLGTLEASWTGAGTPAGSFGKNILFVGVDPVSGRVYVTDDEHDVVDEFAGGVSEGFLGRLTATPAGPLGEAVAVAVARGSGRVYVAVHSEATDTAVVDVFGSDILLPEVSTGAVSGVSAGGGVLHGVVSSGVGGPVSCWFAWGASEALGERVGCAGGPVEGEGVAVSATLEHLAPDTTYFYRLQGAYVSDEEAVNLSEEATAECEGQKSVDACFTTLGAGVLSESVSKVTATGVEFDASVDPNHAPTSYFVEYGPSVGYGSSTAKEVVGSGKGAVAVSVGVQGLASGASYHYRVVALSEISPGDVFATYGADRVFTTQGVGVSGLLDGRQWEMVSPPGKEGALILGPGYPWGVTQAAVGGGAMTYLATGPTENGVVGYSNAQQVLSTRGPSGWSSVDLATPHNGAVSGSVNAGEEYRFFSEDLSQAVLQPFGAFQPCTGAGGARQPCLSEAASEQTAFLRNNTTGAYTPLVSLADDTSSPFQPFGQEGVKEGASCPPEKFCGPFFDGATPDLSHVILSSDTDVQLTAEPAPADGLYEWSAGAPAGEQLQLVSVLPGSEGPELKLASLGTPAQQSGAGGDGNDARHAISEDGSRVFWTSEAGVLYMRDMPRRETVEIGPGTFQTASSDGSRVFWTDGGSLFECEIPEKLQCKPLRLGEAPAIEGSVIGASEDGSYIYWVSAEHELYEDQFIDKIWRPPRPLAALSGEDSSDWAINSESLSNLTARVSPDGVWLAFMSDRPLTGYDNRDVKSGEPDEEVFLYNAETGQLACASCNPTGARPTGTQTPESLVNPEPYGAKKGTWLSADLPAWVAFEKLTGGVARYQPRYLGDGGRLFFDSDDGLVPRDVNGSWDVYEYEPVGVGGCVPGVSSGGVVFKGEREVVSGVVEGAGCVGLMSSGESPQESALLDVSGSGGDVFFMTTAKLAPEDFDDSYDIYDAHECTGVSPCVPVSAGSPAACVTAEACRAAPAPQPSIFGAPASASLTGAGNVTPAAAPPASVRVLTRAQKLAKALNACHRDRRRKKRQACERQAKRRYGAAAKKSSPKKSSHHGVRKASRHGG